MPGKPGATAAIIILLSSAWSPAAAEPPTAAPALRLYLPTKQAAAVEPVIGAAAERLSDPECGRLLDDFADRQGRPLAQRLAALGWARADYLSLVVFVDGKHTRLCQRENVLAVTTPGSRVVALCPEFRRMAHLDSHLAEGVIIHEALHTLGLEENPPSSREINRRIFDHCGR